MAIVTTTTAFSRRYLMNKTKTELCEEVMWRHDWITALHRELLKYGGHTSDCPTHTGHDCLCGFDEARQSAREWLA